MEETLETPPETPEVPAAEVPEIGDGPWKADLESTFDDPALRASVDEFLRGKVQPYVTELEQKSQPGRQAQHLWDEFHNSPEETFMRVTRELHGDDAAERVRRVLTGDTDELDAWDDDLEDPPDAAVEQVAALPPEVQEIVEEHQRSKFQKILDGLKEEFEAEDREGGPIPFDADQFRPFVVVNEGDLDAAKTQYEAWVRQAKETFGIRIPSPEDVNLTPPPTIGSETRSGAITPPQEKTYTSLDDALDDFLAEQNAPPPQVGAA